MNELIILLFLFFMSLGIILLIKPFKDYIYLLILMLLAGWLLFFPQILSQYQVGIDAHYEKIIGEVTLVTGHWNPNLSDNVANGALSIAIYAPYISFITGLPFDYVTKYIFTMFPIFSIPIIWRLNKQILGLTGRDNYLALLLLIGTGSFMLFSFLSRQEVAFFCMILLCYGLFRDQNSTNMQFTIVNIILITALVISHYSTAILIIIIFSIVNIIFWLRKDKSSRLNLTMLSVTIVLFWTIIIVQSTFLGVKYGLQNIIDSIINYATDNVSIVVQQQLNPTYTDIFSTINYLINMGIIILLFLGALYLILNPTFSKNKLHNLRQFHFFSLLLILLIPLSIVPGFSVVYNPERVFLTAIFICSGYFIIGSNWLFQQAQLLIHKIYGIKSLNMKGIGVALLAIAIFLHLLIPVGLPSYFLNGFSNSVYLEDIKTDIHYTMDQEIASITWIKQDANDTNIFTDFYGRGYVILQSYGGFDKKEIIIIKNVTQMGTILGEDNYFYSQKSAIALKNQAYLENQKDIIEVQRFLSSISTIYSSGQGTSIGLF